MMGVRMEKQVKSKQRVADHGEVFTAEREVKAMCDLVRNETEQISARFLEPACGDGNFLAEILTRKLQCSEMQRYRKSPYDWERNSLLCIGSLYGVDIQLDNVLICRERLFDIWNKAYKKICKKECYDETRVAARFILKKNIICGNALTYRRVDENGKETGEPIVFSEWSFLSGKTSGSGSPIIHWKDYSFDELVNGTQGASNIQEGEPKLFDPKEEPKDEGKFIGEDSRHYRRFGNNE